jgi:hypothetical protein
MKTWEMIKELTENPKKKFRLIDNELDLKVTCSDGEIRWTGDEGLYLDDEWEEVKEPVSWKKAFEAGLHGKRIKPVGQDLTFPDYENLIHVFKYLIDRPHFFNEIILGNWYIED